MKEIYAVELVKYEDNDGFMVYVPDFDINTEGKSLIDAIEMARDAISLVGITLVDDNQPIPPSTPIEAVKKEYDGFLTLVDVDFDEYRRKNDRRSVRKNCTIPAWLNDEAEKAGLNFSKVLQSGLKFCLNMK